MRSIHNIRLTKYLHSTKSLQNIHQNLDVIKIIIVRKKFIDRWIFTYSITLSRHAVNRILFTLTTVFFNTLCSFIFSWKCCSDLKIIFFQIIWIRTCPIYVKRSYCYFFICIIFLLQRGLQAFPLPDFIYSMGKNLFSISIATAAK